MLNEALEWFDRAEQAREVASQLTDPGVRRAVLGLADSFDRLARAAATPAILRRRDLAAKDREEPDDLRLGGESRCRSRVHLPRCRRSGRATTS